MKKRSSPSPSGSCSSSSSYALAERLKTIFKKASELSTLCDVEVCVIYFGPNGELKTWPEEKHIVKDIAFRFMQLDENQRRKKSTNLYEFLNNKKKDDKCPNVSNKRAKTKTTNPNELSHLVSEHSSPEQISELTLSLEQSLSTLRERLRFVEARKEKETKLVPQETTTTPIMSHSLNPNQFSLFIFNHGDSTFSQIPPSALNLNLNRYGFENQLCGYDPNNMMCMSSATVDNSFQHLSAVSNTQDCFSALLESEPLNHLMQKELYGSEQNNNNNLDFLDPYFSQDMINSTYGIEFGESSLFPPPLSTENSIW